MKYKLLSIILSIMIILTSSFNVYADIDENINLDNYDYVKYAEAFYSDGEETEKLYPAIYFNDEFNRIYSISISEVVVGGREARGALLEYASFNSNNYDYITPIPSLNQGEKLNGTKRIYGLKRAIISLKADVGELWLKYITGTVNGYSYIIIFSESGHGGDPGTDPEPEPEPEPEPPDTPRNVEVESKAGDIIVTWDLVPGADGYRVWINGNPVDVGNTTKYIFSADEGEYEIQVTAYNNDGESHKSNPVTAIRPSDNPIIIVKPPAIVGVENPIPIYFPDPPPAPKAPSINPLPNPSSYIPKPNDFDLEPDMPSYNPRHYDPYKDGDIFRYDPPPLEIPEPIPSPGPLPSIPDPEQFLIPHDDPITSENPINPSKPYNPEEPREIDSVEVELPKEMTGYEPEPPRNMTGYTPEPPRNMTGYTPEPPRQMNGYTPDPPRQMDLPKDMEPPR